LQLNQDHLVHGSTTMGGVGVGLGGGMGTGGGNSNNFIQNYNPPHPPISTALPYDDDDDEDVLQIFCNQFNHHHRPDYRLGRADGDDANGIGDDGNGGDDEDDDDNSNSGDGGGNGGIIVERVMKRGSGEATHYSSLYVNNQDLLENSGYLMHQQQKYRTMANASVIPPALPMRNTPSNDSSSSNNTSGNGNKSASTLNRHYSHDYQTDQNINTNFKNLSNTHNLDSSCTARRKNY
jgi:hypothetical protein